jgi:glycosyltransferase involved in cell wall biosynthesis
MKVAIVHDYLNQYGGAERVVEAFHEIFPDAPIFTSIHLPGKLPAVFSTFDVRPSFMQRLPFLERHFKKYLPLYPYAIERLDLRGYDLVLSSSSAFAKGVRVAKNACHICYCYTPMRFAWDPEDYLEREEIHPIYRLVLPMLLSRLRRWDLNTIDRVDYYIAISRHIQERIRRIYRREAEVIYPPVDLSKFSISEKTDDYFLIVSRLNAYKRIDLAIEAFNRLSLPLLVIGAGPHEEALKRGAGENVTFLGKVPDKELAEHLGRCRALICPGAEDFGLAPVEAMASGRPVIAYAQGGALETVAEGSTGLFFKNQTVECLMETVRCFEKMEFDPFKIRDYAKRFDKALFKLKIRSYVEEKYGLVRKSL